MKWAQLYGSLNNLLQSLYLRLEWKLNFPRPVATADTDRQIDRYICYNKVAVYNDGIMWFGWPVSVNLLFLYLMWSLTAMGYEPLMEDTFKMGQGRLKHSKTSWILRGWTATLSVLIPSNSMIRVFFRNWGPSSWNLIHISGPGVRKARGP